MNFHASGIGNRFGSLAVNISDPSEISKAKPSKIKIEPKSSKQKKTPHIVTDDSKSSFTAPNVQKELKRSSKENQKASDLAKVHQNVGNYEKVTDKVNEVEQSNASIPSGRGFSKNRGRGSVDSRSNLPARNNKNNPANNEDAYHDSYKNRSRRESGTVTSGYKQNSSGVLVDLDEEVVSPNRYDRGRGRYSNRSSSRNVEGEIPNKRGRVYDRHSGTLTGSVAYNKRENRGPDSALLRESNFVPLEGSVNNSREKLTNSHIDESYESTSEVPAASNTFTLDEFRKMKENQQFASVSITEKPDSVLPVSNITNNVPIDDNSSRRSRGRGGYTGSSGRRGRGGDQRFSSEGAYRYSRSSRPYTDSPQQRQRNVPEDIKLDLEKDFPALNI